MNESKGMANEILEMSMDRLEGSGRVIIPIKLLESNENFRDLMGKA